MAGEVSDEQLMTKTNIIFLCDKEDFLISFFFLSVHNHIIITSIQCTEQRFVYAYV